MNPITEEILTLFESHQMPKTPDDLYEIQGRTLLAQQIDRFVNNRQPIKFFMLGYPMKSPNDRDKVLGKPPDQMERASFQNFKYFADQVQSIYTPGVRYALISDGYVFGDILRVPESVVINYAERVQDMAASIGVPVSWYDLRDFYPAQLSVAACIEKLMVDYGISQIELERRINFVPDTNRLYTGMIRFMEGDIALWGFPSRNQLNKQAKIVAREMLTRNEAYGALAKASFPGYIKLSMHPSQNNGEKYGFQLIPSPMAKHSPWHAALAIRKDGAIETIHKKDALEKGYEIVNVNGQPFYMQEV